MVESKVRDNTPKKRHLITKGEWPESAGGGKSTLEEKIIFTVFVLAVIVILFVFFL